MNASTTHTETNFDTMIIIDADFADRVAFDLIVNFERIINRRIPNADMARWVDCLSLDGGLTEGNHHIQVVLIHSKGKSTMDYFSPSDLESDLNGKAFRDNLGEFVLTSVSEEDIASRDDLLLDTLQLAIADNSVNRVVIVPDEEYYDHVRSCLRHVPDSKRVTVLAMQPMPGGNFRQEILGYSLMSALGIRSDEIQ